MDDPLAIAKELIESSKYLSLATSIDDTPWVTPLYFAHDEKYNFYFISRKDTLHTEHIYKNPKVSFCIFNTEDKSSSGQGLQASGKASEVSLKEILHAIKVIYSKKFPNPKDFSKHKMSMKDVTGAINCRIYKIVPEHVFVLDPGNPEMDTRVEVKL